MLQKKSIMTDPKFRPIQFNYKIQQDFVLAITIIFT